MATSLEIIKSPPVTEFLAGAHLPRLATCNPNTLQPHVVPVWYEWDGTYIWISSFSATRKVREIIQNPLISLVVDAPGGESEAPGVVIEGIAELITDPAFGIKQGVHIYTRYLGPP